MPSLSKLACLAVAAAAAFSTADAASLRTSTSKSLMSSLSAAHSKALKALTTKYDCDLGAADLVGTLKKVTSKSQEADEALTKACAEYQSGYEADLETKLGEADTLDNSAQGKGDAVYADAEKVANEAFGKIESEHGTLVGDAQKAAEDADAKQSAAMGNAEEKNKKKNDARALFELQTKNRNDDADAAKDVLRAARDGSIETAKGIKDGSIKAAGDTKKASDEKCKSAYDTRMSLVTGDEDVVKNKIKPLLEQLKACNSVSAGEDHSGGGSFLEVKAKTKCKKAAREKLRHLQSLLQVSLNIAETPAAETPAAETPAKEVTGNVASFESRLTQEKTFSENVLKACNDEAEGILNDATAAAQDVYEKATKDANTLCSDEEAKVDKATEEHLTPLKKIAEDAEGPALAADAALKTASDELEQAQGRLKAAEDLQTSQMGEAAKVKKDALEEAEKAKQQTIQNTKDAADSIRKTAREDKEKKEKAKKEECEASHARLKEERELVAQIKAKISTLTTVRDDEIGEKDDCASKPCKNGGKCHDGVGSYTCECAHGWTGDNCETNVDDCASNPCKNGGTCHDGVGSYTCECAKGFSGDNCDIKMVTKTKVTCGGFNKYGSNKAYICQRGHLEMIGQGNGNCKQHCVDRGAACGAYSVRENDSGCKLFKVKNNGGNWNSGCETDSNWRGFYKRDCTTTEVQETDECHPEPCKNGGTCHDGDGSYTCECAHGWTGDNCETANGFAPTDSDQCIAGAKRRDVGVLYMRIKYQNKWRSGIAIRCGYKPGTWIKLDPKNYENIENGKTLIHFGMADIGWPDETSNPVHVKEGYGPDMSEWIQFTQEGDLRVFQSPVSPSDSDTGTSVSETFNIDGETYKRLNRVVDGWWGEHLFGVRFEPWKEKN